MNQEAATPRSRLEAWLHNAHRPDPRLLRIMALERRAATQTGDVRRLLEERLAELVDAYAEDLDAAMAAAPADTTSSAPPDSRPDSALGDLIGHLAAYAAPDDGVPDDATARATRQDSLVLDDLRQVCAEVRTESQLRQALAPAPADAGPLNSASLVHRALTRMRDLSPDYLEHFVAYVDALSGLEPICAKHVPGADSASNTTSGRKPSTSRSRRRPA